MPKENNGLEFEGLNAPLFREFAAECIELAQGASSPEERALYAKMASVWHQMAQRWEKKFSQAEDEARRIAANIAKLPELLQKT